MIQLAALCALCTGREAYGCDAARSCPSNSGQPGPAQELPHTLTVWRSDQHKDSISCCEVCSISKGRKSLLTESDASSPQELGTGRAGRETEVWSAAWHCPKAGRERRQCLPPVCQYRLYLIDSFTHAPLERGAALSILRCSERESNLPKITQLFPGQSDAWVCGLSPLPPSLGPVQRGLVNCPVAASLQARLQ